MNVWLVNAGDNYDTAWAYLDNMGVSVTCLLDVSQTSYHSYTGVPNSYAPFPVQVVIDRHGVITYLNGQYDAEAVRAAIDAALADE